MDEPVAVEKKAERPAPQISFDEDYLPEIKDWKVGGKYTLHVEVEQVSLDKDSGMTLGGEEPKKMNARFKVLSVRPSKEKQEESEESEESENGTEYSAPKGRKIGEAFRRRFGK